MTDAQREPANILAKHFSEHDFHEHAKTGDIRETNNGRFMFNGVNWVHESHWNTPIWYQCQHCNATFTHQDHLAQHAEQHAVVKGQATVLYEELAKAAGVTVEEPLHLDLDPDICAQIPERKAVAIFNTCTALLQSKGDDYGRNEELDTHYNFRVSEQFTDIFPHPYHSYAVLMATKIARIAVLLQKAQREEKPKHESIDDSFVDLINYVALMYERYKMETRQCK